MASWAKPEFDSEPDHKGPTLVAPLKGEIQSVGPGLPRAESPEGWVKKVDRPGGKIRTYIKSCFEYAVDEDLLPDDGNAMDRVRPFFPKTVIPPPSPCGVNIAAAQPAGFRYACHHMNSSNSGAKR